MSITNPTTTRNLFDLDAKIPENSVIADGGDIGFRKRKVRTNRAIIQGQQETVLKDYIEIPLQNLASIHLNDFIKYKLEDGLLKLGGRVKQITREPDGTFTFVVTNFNGMRGTRYSINSNKLTAIYKRIDTEKKSATPYSNMDELTGMAEPRRNIDIEFPDQNSYKNKINALETRIQILETKLKEVINFINQVNQE